MVHTVRVDLDDAEHLTLLAKAVSTKVRIRILKLLCQSSFNINEIAEQLQIPASSAAANIRVLEEAGVIKTELHPGVRGSMKLCSIYIDEIGIKILTKENTDDKSEIINMPIGDYVDCKVKPICGLASEKGPIGIEDEPRSFYALERTSAKLLWFHVGYVEYRFPNYILKRVKEKEVEISVELCSKDHEYNLQYPSHITLWLNDLEVGTFICTSDFGGRRGKLNPHWWPDKNTQYGVLKTWRVNETGSFLDDIKVSDYHISDYELGKKEYITVRIGIKPNTRYIGGVTLLGDCFGDYSQNIVMKIKY